MSTLFVYCTFSILRRPPIVPTNKNKIIFLYGFFYRNVFALKIISPPYLSPSSHIQCVYLISNCHPSVVCGRNGAL